MIEENKAIYYDGMIDWDKVYSKELETEYKNRFDQAKFTDEFMQLVMYNPKAKYAYNCLKSGYSPYFVIEQLCDFIFQHDLHYHKTIEDLLLNQPARPIQITYNEYKKFKKSVFKYNVKKFFKKYFSLKKWLYKK